MTTNDDGGETNQISEEQPQHLKEMQEQLTQISKDVASIKRILTFFVIVVLIGIALSVCTVINNFFLSYGGL